MAHTHSKSRAVKKIRRPEPDPGDRESAPKGVLISLVRSSVRPHRRVLAVIALMQIFQAAGNLYLPTLNANIINNGVIKADLGYIGWAGGIMVGIAVVLCIASLICLYLTAWVATSVGAGIRASVYERVQTFSVVEMNRFGISSLTTRTVNDVQQIQLFVQVMLSVLVISVVTTFGAVILAVKEGPGLSLVLGISVVVLVVLTGLVVVRLLPLYRTVQIKTDGLSQVMREQISGIRVARAFLRTGWEAERFGRANAQITNTAMRAGKVYALVTPIVMGVTNLSSVLVFWLGGRLVAHGTMPIGNLTAFLLYLLQILLYVGIAVSVLVLLPRAAASAERIQQVIDTAPAITEPPRTSVPFAITGGVEFRRVSFGYAGSERPVLDNLNFTFLPGRVNAVLGGTGSGKSTLLNLIPRLLDPSSGAVLVNGIEASEQSAERLRLDIGFVPQKAYLFAGTVADNLRFGRPNATEQQLWQALEIAQARDYVAALPGQLDARVERGGANLSGGQRQRLSIARALVRRPSLYLFDDCFSALDAATDARLRAALVPETSGATVVIVAQRASTVMDADQIVVLDNGRIAGIGTHEQLLADCVTYQEIIASQLGTGALT